MSKSLLLSLLGAAALGSALLAGCGDSDKKPEAAPAGPLSGLGESCDKSADCASGLVCFSKVCTNNPGAGGEGGQGPTPTTPLGGVGETCQAHADCQSGLGCYNNHCAAMPAADAGPPVVQLGQRGESCQAASDCASGLACVVITTATSVCDIAKYPTTASNKMCVECTSAADCCELPAATQTSEGVKSCADIADNIGSANCTTTTDTVTQRWCFLQSAYCTCAGSTWSCTNNQCVYTASCKANGLVKSGCPLETRTGVPVLGPGAVAGACDTTASKCAPAAGTVMGCANDDECATLSMTVVDDSPDVCTAGECKCVIPTGVTKGSCYRKCAQNIDCAAGFVCDKTASLCVAQPQCSADAECVTLKNDVTAKCDQGSCKIPCVTDHQCSGSGVSTGAVTGSVCGTDGFCTPPNSGCISDNSCVSAGGRRQFCVDVPTASPGTVFHSAVTTGKGS